MKISIIVLTIYWFIIILKIYTIGCLNHCVSYDRGTQCCSWVKIKPFNVFWNRFPLDYVSISVYWLAINWSLSLWYGSCNTVCMKEMFYKAKRLTPRSAVEHNNEQVTSNVTLHLMMCMNIIIKNVFTGKNQNNFLEFFFIIIIFFTMNIVNISSFEMYNTMVVNFCRRPQTEGYICSSQVIRMFCLFVFFFCIDIGTNRHRCWGKKKKGITCLIHV